MSRSFQIFASIESQVAGSHGTLIAELVVQIANVLSPF